VASILGFTVFQAGMCLASARVGHEAPTQAAPKPAVSATVKKRRGRAIHASALHIDEAPPRL
jgi:hypothetical protein